MKKFRITALILSLVMLVGMLPVSIFAATEEAPVQVSEQSAESVLEALADGKKLYTGPTAADSDTSVFSSPTISGVLKPNDYTLAKNADGSTSLVAKSQNPALGETSVAYTTNRNGGAAYKMDARYMVFTTNISRGEDYFNASKHFLRIKLYYDNGGTVANKEMLVFRLDDASKMIQDESTLTKRAYFGTEAYTNITVVFDSVNKSYDSYINGNLVAQNVSLGLSATQELHSIYFFAKHTYGAERFAGVFSRHGRTENFYTDTYPTITAMNGLYEFEGNYYYYQNGALAYNTTVEYGGYVLELDDNSGRVVNVFKATNGLDEYSSLNSNELSALLEADGDTNSQIIANSNVTTSVAGSIKSYLNKPIKPYALADGTVADASTSLEVISADYNASTHFTFNTKRVGTNIQYYASADDLANGKLTTPATELQYDVRSFNGSYANRDFVIKYPVKFGEGVNTLSIENDTTKTVNLLRAIIKNDSGSQYRPYVVQLRRAEGENTHLILCGIDVGPCDIENVTDITFRGRFVELSDGGKDLYLDVYVNGELKVENYNATASSTLVLSRFYGLQLRDDGGYDWQGEFITFYPSVSYYATTNLESVTDDFTGVINNGKYSIYYENGAIKERGTYEALDAKYGVTDVTLSGYNVALGDILNLNFYVNADDLYSDSEAYALLTVGDKVQKVMLRDIAKEGDSYKITAKLSSIEMDTDVALSVFDGEGNAVKLIKGNTEAYSYTYSIRRYCEYVIENANDFTAQAVDAVKALLIYGAAAERNFNGTVGYKTASALSSYERQETEYHSINGNSATVSNITGFDTDHFLFDDITNIPVDLTGYTSDADIVGDVRLVLDYAIKIRISLNTVAAPTSVEGAKLVTKTENGVTKYYVDIEGITAKELNTLKTVIIDGTVEIGITGMAIANAVLSDTGDVYGTDFKNLMRAMVAYYYYTAEYAKTVQ